MSSFTYDDTLSTTLAYLRFRIGDTQSAYRKFYDEELDAILSKNSDDVDESRGECFGIMAQDPDRLMLTKDGTAGAFTLLALMGLYTSRSAEWRAS